LGLAGPVCGKFDLVICEGELNALSIWQVAHEGRADVLSLGSESQHITDAMLKAISEYRRVIVWMDKADKLAELRGRIPGATGIASPHSMDANDCLQKGTLQPMIADLRLRACKDDAEREALLWDLWDQHNLYGGVDEPTQALIAELRGRLGK
jgi:5S rRNA maturation endonuclease (ribonuclease M5)